MMQMIRCAAVLLACLTGCSALCGCASGTSGEDSGSGLWLGIEPAKEDEFGKVTYADGIYLSQNVQEPVPDPYADDTEEKETGETGDGLRYTLYQRHAEITGHSDSFELEELDIPAEIGGLPVTRITDVALNEGSVFDLDRNGAFYSCYTLRRVNVPEGVREIGQYAFYGCKNLQEISLPESLMEIGTHAFSMCSSLKEMTVPSGIDKIGESAFSLTPWYDDLLYHRDLVIFNGRLYDAGRRCTGHITVPDYVVSVADYAFYSCEGLETVVLPASVKSVGKYAFCDCPDLYGVLFLNPECEIPEDASTLSNKVTGSDRDFYKGIVYGEENSTAQRFARKFDYRFESTADFFARMETWK